ncbi:MAG: cysteine hydrolase [Chloroflexi bacterium]|nr:cysteine hydrolase [Chloroflexota bacterium]MBV9545669.1 cysteine hydrolase [Chloroflexota bacterium]
MAGNTLLVVDVQRGFINSFTRHIPARIARLIDTGAYETVLYTRFVNSPDSPYHRLLDWHGSSEAPETELADEVTRFAQDGNVYDKHGLTGVPDTLAERVTGDKLQEIAVVGIDTDMCVLKIAMDLFDLGIEPIVLIDCCASTAGLQAHLAGLAILSRNIGPHQLRLTDLHEGYLTAPDDDPSPD